MEEGVSLGASFYLSLSFFVCYLRWIRGKRSFGLEPPAYGTIFINNSQLKVIGSIVDLSTAYGEGASLSSDLFPVMDARGGRQGA